MFELNFKDVPTKELWERIQTVNEKTMQAPPHLRAQLYNLYQALMHEYSQRPDRN